MAGAAPAGAEGARRVGAAGGARTPAPPRDESAFRPTRRTNVPFVQPGRTNVAFVQLQADQSVLERDWTPPPEAAGGRSRPTPAPDESAFQPDRRTWLSSNRPGRMW